MRSKVLSAVAAVVLAAALVPVAPQGALANDDMSRQAPIEELLAAGDYVEGEAIALVRSDGGLDAANDAETLAEVGADVVKLAAEKAAESEDAVDDAVSLRAQSAQAEAYTVQHVVDPTRTTEQILRDLYADPDVIAAEPDYIFDASALFADEGQTTAPVDATQQPGATLAAGAADLSASSGEFAENPGDLTEQQWNLSAGTESYTTPLSPVANYNVNVPGWREGRTNEDAQANASGTVCIVDTGLDVNHRP